MCLSMCIKPVLLVDNTCDNKRSSEDDEEENAEVEAEDLTTTANQITSTEDLATTANQITQSTI